MNREEPYLSTYLHAKGSRLGLPVSGNFELTSRCNFRCPMCYVHNGNEGMRERELTADQWLGLAEEACRQGMVFALLTGGEPFIREDFFEIFDGMKRMGLLLSVNSNGSLLNDEIIERLAEDPPFRINISLYGNSEETYYRMCGVSCHEKVINNIKALRARGIDVRLNVSLTQYNAGDIGEILQTAKELGVHIKTSAYMYPPRRLGGEPGKGNRMDPLEAAETSVRYDRLRFSREEFKQRAENMKKGICEREDCALDPSGEGMRCRAGSASFWLTWDGRMLPCGLMTAPEAYPLKTGFAAAWKEIREKTSEIKLPAACTSCAKRNICCICAAVNESETGGYNQPPEYVCRMTGEIARLTELYAASDDGESLFRKEEHAEDRLGV